MFIRSSVLFLLLLVSYVSAFSCPDLGTNVTKCSCSLEKGSSIFASSPESKGFTSCIGETVNDVLLLRYSEVTSTSNKHCRDTSNSFSPEDENELYDRSSSAVSRFKDHKANVLSPKYCSISKLILNRTQITNLNGSLFSNFILHEIQLVHNYQLENIDPHAFNLSKTTLKRIDISYSKVSGFRVINWAAGFENLLSLKILVENLDSIDKNTFGRFRFKKLQELDLSDNLISRISDYAFFDMVELKALKLNGNNLHTIPPQMLSFGPPPTKMTNVKLLIDMSKNHISADLIDPRCFSSFLRPVNLDLSHNTLHTLPEKPFKTFLFSDYRNTIDLKGNPFICDESNGWILKHILYMNYSRGGTDEDINPEFRTEIVGDLTFLYERTKPDYSYYKIRDFICENNHNIFAI